MVQSALVTRTIPHHNKLGARNGRSIDRVIQHHWAGPGGDARLANPTQQASSNYLIYSDGTIAIQVPEEYRAWTSGSFEADVNSITIEVENVSYQKHGNDNHPDSWAISDAAYNSIVALLADISRRYGWGGITDDRYRGHREFSSTACPGGYLWARMADIRAHANAALGSGIMPVSSPATTTPTPEEGFLMALTDQQQKDVYWILCTKEGREFLAEHIGGRAASKTLNTSIKRGGVATGVTTLGGMVAWNDDHVSRTLSAVAASAASDGASVQEIQKAVKDAMASIVKVEVSVEGGK